jgi:hypothetical protein
VVGSRTTDVLGSARNKTNTARGVVTASISIVVARPWMSASTSGSTTGARAPVTTHWATVALAAPVCFQRKRCSNEVEVVRHQSAAAADAEGDRKSAVLSGFLDDPSRRRL